MLGFSSESQNLEVFVSLPKGNSTTDTFPAILEILRTKEIFVVDSVFHIVIGEWIEQF